MSKVKTVPRSDSDYGCLIVAIIIFIGLVSYAISLIEDYFPRVPGVVALIVSILGIAVGLYLLNLLYSLLYRILSKILEIYMRFSEQNRRCIHGIKHKDTCVKCEQEREEKLLRVKLQRQKDARIGEIRKRANDLRKKQLDTLLSSKLKTLDYLLSLTPDKFEDLIAEMFRRLGYEVEQTPYVNDRGKDAILKKDGEKYLVECKKYGKGKVVGRPHLQKFYAAIEEEKAAKGYFVTTGRFSLTALEYAGGFKIETVDGEELIKLMKKAFPGYEDIKEMKVMCLICGDVVTFPMSDDYQEKLCSRGHRVERNIKNSDIRLTVTSSVKYCKRCGREMKVVNGYRGKFWGCTGYPICTYRMSFRD